MNDGDSTAGAAAMLRGSILQNAPAKMKLATETKADLFWRASGKWATRRRPNLREKMRAADRACGWSLVVSGWLSVSPDRLGGADMQKYGRRAS